MRKAIPLRVDPVLLRAAHDLDEASSRGLIERSLQGGDAGQTTHAQISMRPDSNEWPTLPSSTPLVARPR